SESATASLRPKLTVVYATGAPVVAPPTARSDANGDGKSDIVWYNTSTGVVATWWMDGFTMQNGATIGTVPPPNYVALGVGDLDVDGKADILWRNVVTGDIYVWFIDGTTIKATSST